MSVRKFYLAALIGAASFTAPAAAVTMQEGDGNFSNDWLAPTVVTSGTTGVSGTGAPEWMRGDRLDIFQFSGLEPGATSVVFDFALTEPYGRGSYRNGGGSIYYSYEPFTNNYTVDRADGTVLRSQDLLAGVFDVTYDPWSTDPSKRGTSTFSLDLMDDFAGELFLALDFNYGQVSYNVNSPAWASSTPDTGGPTGSSGGGGASPTAVPLPATGWLLLGGLAGVVGLTVKRRKPA